MTASPLISRRDLAFVLYDLLDVGTFIRHARYADHSRETFDAAIETAHRLALEKFHPHNAKGDKNEPTFDGNVVSMIPEVAEALAAFRDAGFFAPTKDYELGGMQLPLTVAQACNAMFQSANIGSAGYPFLTVGAANLIESFGSQEQKSLYMAPMLAGRFFGTMCLSEPQAGSSLADIRTRAEPQEDGSYRVIGNKMWISGGDHELSENIVHMVLAKIPGGPPGVRGISLFIVPKHVVNPDGSVGQRNDVRLAGLNHKMGYRGTTNTVLNFGEKGGAVGYLLGQPHRGLEYMFQMMNEARIGVGQGAVMLAYAAYLFSLEYARGRPQGRAPDSKDPASPMIPIVEHADIKRMLLHQKWASEGGLHLCLYAASLVDRIAMESDATEKAQLELLLDTLTPIVKGWLSEVCLKSNEHAVQILGGYGYTRDYPVEQYYRDQRLNPIHEGTDGIQAIDLLGRKMAIKGGAGWNAVKVEIARAIGVATAHDQLKPMARDLTELVETIDATRATLLGAMGKGQASLALANAFHFLDLFGLLVMGWMWLWQASAIQDLPPATTDEERAFRDGKLAACRYFFAYEVPRSTYLASLLGKLDDTTLTMKSEWFA
ncbi:MAG: acyl-CoA dehydrogenase [Alphaproteobacteria bacterium]|nr:acyl-CoA dehydrogenase [Alphaproteobacteria bacterium]